MIYKSDFYCDAKDITTLSITYAVVYVVDVFLVVLFVGGLNHKNIMRNEIDQLNIYYIFIGYLPRYRSISYRSTKELCDEGRTGKKLVHFLLI